MMLQFILITIGAVSVFKKIFDNLFPDKQPKVDSNDNKKVIKNNQLPSINYSNERYVNGSLRNYYQNLLDLSEAKEINPEVIYNHYYNKLNEVEESFDDKKIKDTIGLDLIAAREYIHDLCRYIGNKN